MKHPKVFRADYGVWLEGNAPTKDGRFEPTHQVVPLTALVIERDALVAFLRGLILSEHMGDVNDYLPQAARWLGVELEWDDERGFYDLDALEAAGGETQ